MSSGENPLGRRAGRRRGRGSRPCARPCRPALARRRPSRRRLRRARRTARACSRNVSSPSFSEIELATPLPCRHLSPASSAEKRELSTMIGSRAISGSVAIRLRNVVIACSASSRSASMFDVEEVRAAAHLLERDVDRALEVARLDQPPEARRAGDVRPLADDDEARVRPDHERLETAEARARAPRAGTTPRRASPSTDLAICATCSGVVPQQPPTMLTSPSSANVAQEAARVLGLLVVQRRTRSAGRRSDGRRRRSIATRASSSRNGRISVAPSEQLTPTIERTRRARRDPERLHRLPERLRPLAVDRRERDPERQLRRLLERRGERRLRVQRVEDRLDEQQVDAALAERRASARRTPRTHLVERDRAIRAGRRPAGDSESVTFSGPTRAGDEAGLRRASAVHSSAARRASRAPSRLISRRRPRARSRPGRSGSR